MKSIRAGHSISHVMPLGGRGNAQARLFQDRMSSLATPQQTTTTTKQYGEKESVQKKNKRNTFDRRVEYSQKKIYRRDFGHMRWIPERTSQHYFFSQRRQKRGFIVIVTRRVRASRNYWPLVSPAKIYMLKLISISKFCVDSMNTYLTQKSISSQHQS